MTDPSAAFTKLVPGFDFLQGLVKNAGSAMPGIGSWVAPTLDPDELDKRIQELRTVQYWLEQNARLLATTIQAMEVQRMTLSTLKSMNLSMGELAESLKIRVPEPAPAAAPAAKAPAPAATPAPAAQAKADAGAAAPAVPAGVIDPMQWWGALTKQFTDIAANALKDTGRDNPADAARQMAENMMKQGADAASGALKMAAAMPAQVAQGAAAVAQQAAGASSKVSSAGTARATRTTGGAAPKAASRKRAAR
jgi:hypothetical protein